MLKNIADSIYCQNIDIFHKKGQTGNEVALFSCTWAFRGLLNAYAESAIIISTGVAQWLSW